MTINTSNGLAFLSMLSGTNSYSNFGLMPEVETRLVRAAKAQFTLTSTTPPWKEAASRASESSQISSVKQLKSLIDLSVNTPNAGSADVQTAFTAYKALERLRLLATVASGKTTTVAERTTLQSTSARGLADTAATLAPLKSAISTTQTAYRSLYWDDSKAALTDGRNATALTAAQSAQLDNYQSALARLTPAADTTISTFLTGF